MPRTCSTGRGSTYTQCSDYPRGLCEAFVQGIQIQKDWDGKGFGLMANGTDSTMIGSPGVEHGVADGGGLYQVGCGDHKHNKMQVPNEEGQSNKLPSNGVAWDEVNGAILEFSNVRVARLEEIQYYRKMCVYKKKGTHRRSLQSHRQRSHICKIGGPHQRRPRPP